MTAEIPDPIAKAAQIICGKTHKVLEERLKTDIVASISRVKPDQVHGPDFDQKVKDGTFFAELSAPLQGIAIAKIEGALAFYNRISWNESFLSEDVENHLKPDELTALRKRYHTTTLHDLAYVHPKHFEKALGKVEAAKLWEKLRNLALRE